MENGTLVVFGINDTTNSDLNGMQNDLSYLTACSLYDFVVEGILMGILCLFGFCGNTLSMICLSKDKSKTATPFLLVSLEAADTLFLITVLFLRVFNSIGMYYNYYNDHIIWAYAGKYMYPFALITETGTIYVTLLVTLNRYVMVCKPYDASTMCSVPHARQHVFLVVAFAIIYNIPRFFEYTITEIHNETTNKTTFHAMPSDMLQNTVYQIVYANIIYFIIMFLIPLVLLIFLNSNLILALRETKRKRARMMSQRDTSSRSEEDITLILIVVVLVFVICQTPALITQVLANVRKANCGTYYFYYIRISDLLVVGNSSLNFLIYCFCSKKFRQVLKSLLCKQNSTTVSNGVNCPTSKYRPVPLKHEINQNGINANGLKVDATDVQEPKETNETNL